MLTGGGVGEQNGAGGRTQPLGLFEKLELLPANVDLRGRRTTS